mmetsp:Transcript_7408/g.15470  ORF Transcript_7408/g.15470 Transcript_7408/m.15470 type:complete len:124 (-) Transcript_7408:87-458(-)
MVRGGVEGGDADSTNTTAGGAPEAWVDAAMVELSSAALTSGASPKRAPTTTSVVEISANTLRGFSDSVDSPIAEIIFANLMLGSCGNRDRWLGRGMVQAWDTIDMSSVTSDKRQKIRFMMILL